MKKIYLSFLTLILLQSISLAQSSWELINPLPTLHNLTSIHFIDPNIGWMAGERGIVLKSTDGGISWKTQESGTNYDIGDLYFNDDENGWIVVNYGRTNIINTENGGTSWNIQLDTLGILSSIFFIDASTGWVVGNMYDGVNWVGAILKTTNGGKEWFEQISGTLYGLSSVYFINDDVGWAAGGLGTIVKTTNGGNNWYPLASGTTINLNSICFIDESIGWTVGHYSLGFGDYWSTIFKTTDGGQTWIPVLNTAGEFGSILFPDTAYGWVAGYKITGSTNYGAVMRTTDGGNNWSEFNVGPYLNTVYMLDRNIGWTVGDIGKIFKTENKGESWFTLYRDIINTDLYGVDFINDSKGWIVGPGSSYYTTDGGQNWTEMYFGWGYPYALDFVNEFEGWMVGTNKIWHTADGGISWTVQADGLGFNSVFFIDSFNGWTVGDFGSSWEYTKILHTSNGGLNWVEQYNHTNASLEYIDFINNLEGWAVGGFIGTSQSNATILHTSDGGENWIMRFDSLEGRFSSVDFVDSLNGWVTHQYPQSSCNGILKTTDGGFSWGNGYYTSSSLGSVYFVDKLNGWFAGYPSILKTTDGGLNWVDQKSPEGCSNICMLDTNRGFAIGQGSVFLKMTPGGTVSMDENNFSCLSGYILNQNHPNPFNPTTTIKYSIPEMSKVTLTLFNLLGEKVTTLINEEKPAGSYEVEFNSHSDEGQNLSSGVYFYQLKAGDFIETKKMLLLK